MRRRASSTSSSRPSGPSRSTRSWSRATSTTGPSPPVDAVDRCSTTPSAGSPRTGVRVVLISGNHDSARRLGFGADLIDAAGIHLRTDPAGSATPVLLDDGDGPVAFYGAPLPRARRGRASSAATRAATPRCSARPWRGSAPTWPARPGTRSVVVAHAFVVGGEPSDSERDISVGGSAPSPRSTFAGVDYAALGHLHGAQDSPPASATPAPRSRTRSPRRTSARPCCSWIWRRARRRGRPSITCPPRRAPAWPGSAAGCDDLLTDGS